MMLKRIAQILVMALALHIIKMSGKNSHHILEGVYKSVARSLKEAVAIDKEYEDEIP